MLARSSSLWCSQHVAGNRRPGGTPPAPAAGSAGVLRDRQKRRPRLRPRTTASSFQIETMIECFIAE
jgi:hypothetical protein